MDANCRIRLTKARLKEEVCEAFSVAIPHKVREEVMAGAEDHLECGIVQGNLDRGVLRAVSDPHPALKGEDSARAAYGMGGTTQSPATTIISSDD